MAVTIAIESPMQDEIRALIVALDEILNEMTPLEHNYPMTADQMADPAMTVFVAREDGSAIGCGALRRHAGGIAEVKRMFTVPAAQGRGIGGRILAEIEGLARREGFVRLVLETGCRHDAAWRIYERGGFRRCPPVLDYPDSEWSVFYEKALATSEQSAA